MQKGSTLMLAKFSFILLTNEILIVRQIIEKAIEFNKPTYICIVDFSKALDSIK